MDREAWGQGSATVQGVAESDITNTRKYVPKQTIIHTVLKGIFREKCPV